MDPRLAMILSELARADDPKQLLRTAAGIVSAWALEAEGHVGPERLESVLSFMRSDLLRASVDSYVFINGLMPDLGEWDSAERAALVSTMQTLVPEYREFAAKLAMAETIGMYSADEELIGWLDQVGQWGAGDREAAVRAAWMALAERNRSADARRIVEQKLSMLGGDEDAGVRREARTAIASLSADGRWRVEMRN